MHALCVPIAYRCIGQDWITRFAARLNDCQRESSRNCPAFEHTFDPVANILSGQGGFGAVYKLRKDTAPINQLLVGADLGDPPLVEDDNSIGMQEG